MRTFSPTKNTGLIAIACMTLQLLMIAPPTTHAGETPSGKGVATTETKSSGFFNFTSTSLWYLYGFNWDTPFSASEERDLITLEHFNDNKFGDFFLFVDFMNLTTYDTGLEPKTGFDVYGEASPRLSLSKLTGKEPGKGFIKDFFIYSGTFEFGRAGSLKNINQAFGTDIDYTQTRQLHGVAVDFNMPGFLVSSLNLYWRDDLDLDGSTWQLTYVWIIPFSIGSCDFKFLGFADFAGSEDYTVETFHSSPQLIMDIGKPLGLPKGKLYAGVEVDIWINEFGVKGQDDFVPQALITYFF
ncbi:hypothetical protein FEM03_02115 [Phragmitibacter flavus]|uniref:Nucleoside-binding protein n=1 Tax=Phragmitibacter flavus TaxID=2576071 RepID=A0A5R8KIN7_9BACT|nr:outer membrane protein OmpK [Phragmitibacter flavus]TLD72174.1 hypothetical protein FEM03_02115 [Phragmitibacter flavus]